LERLTKKTWGPSVLRLPPALMKKEKKKVVGEEGVTKWK